MMPLRSQIGGHFVLSCQSFCNSVIVPFCNYVWNFNLAYNFSNMSTGVGIYHISFSRDNTFTKVPTLLTWWPGPWSLIFFLKTFTLQITFERWKLEVWYFTWAFLETKHFRGYQHFWPCNTDLGVWPIFWKLLIIF